MLLTSTHYFLTPKIMLSTLRNSVRCSLPAHAERRVALRLARRGHHGSATRHGATAALAAAHCGTPSPALRTRSFEDPRFAAARSFSSWGHNINEEIEASVRALRPRGSVKSASSSSSREREIEAGTSSSSSSREREIGVAPMLDQMNLGPKSLEHMTVEEWRK